ncbi:MAG TPA: SGNH/GDSL hydrolase family protein [Nocardioides sp.]|uniref:SGNH/GDSL hydrolase family protein n=1 Tax=Nocardioides sp. TaxID=35761 RepID=UPI002ED86551
MAYTTAQLLSALLMVDGRAVEGGPAVELPPNARLLLDVLVEGAEPSDLLGDLAQAVADAQAARDGAVAIAGPVDATVEALVKNTGGVGPLTQAALSATIAAAVPDIVDAELGPRYSLLASGSSQAAGVGTTTPSTDNYPTVTAGALGGTLSVTVGLTNGGVSGDNTAQMLAALPALLATHRPNVVLIEVSVNDVKATAALTTDQTVTNIFRMAALARLAGAEPVIVTGALFHPGFATLFPGLSTDFTDATHRNFVAAIRAVKTRAATLGIRVADTYEVLRYKSWLPSDGLHYTTGAAADVASAIANRIMGVDPLPPAGTLIFAYTFGVIGGEWSTIGGGTWTADGTAYSSTDTANSMLVVDSGGTGQSLTVDLTWASGVADGAIVCRNDGTANAGYVAGVYPNGGNTDFRLYRLGSGGSLTLLKSAASVPITGNACQIQLNCTSDAVMAWLDGVPYLSTWDSTSLSGTRAGLRHGTNAAVRFDNATMRR